MKRRKLKKRLRRVERALKLEIHSSEHVRRGVRKILIERCPTIPPVHDDVALIESLERFVEKLADRAAMAPGDPGAWWDS